MAKSLISANERSFALFRDDKFNETLGNLVEKIESSVELETTEWFGDLTAYTGELADVGQKTAMTEAAILSTVKRLWTEEKIRPEITSQWDGLFWNWAKFVSQRGIEAPTEVSLQNRISVYEFYFANQNKEGGFALPPTLVYELKVVDPAGETTIEEVTVENPNLHSAAYGKLLAAKGLAIKQGGNLSDATIAAMINPSVTIRDFRDILKLEKEANEELNIIDLKPESDEEEEVAASPAPADENSLSEDFDPGDTSDEEPTPAVFMDMPEEAELDLTILDEPDSEGIYYQEGIIYYHQDDITVPAFVLATAIDGATHPLVSVGQRYVLSRFGIHDPELDVEPAPIEGPMFVPDDENDTGILNFNGYQFAQLKKAEVLELASQLNAWLESQGDA